MKRVIPLLVIYLLLQRGLDRRVEKALLPDGISIDTVLQDKKTADPSLTYQVVDKATFEATPSKAPIQDIATQKDAQQALSEAKDKSKKTDERLDALIKALFP